MQMKSIQSSITYVYRLNPSDTVFLLIPDQHIATADTSSKRDFTGTVHGALGAAAQYRHEQDDTFAALSSMHMLNRLRIQDLCALNFA